MANRDISSDYLYSTPVLRIKSPIGVFLFDFIDRWPTLDSEGGLYIQTRLYPQGEHEQMLSRLGSMVCLY